MVSVPQNNCNVTSGFHQLIGLSDERDLWISFTLSIARASYRAGHRDGWYRHKNRTETRQLNRRPREIAWGPAHADMEIRRYGEGGRDEWVLKGPVCRNGSFYGDR